MLRVDLAIAATFNTAPSDGQMCQCSGCSCRWCRSCRAECYSDLSPCTAAHKSHAAGITRDAVVVWVRTRTEVLRLRRTNGTSQQTRCKHRSDHFPSAVYIQRTWCPVPTIVIGIRPAGFAGRFALRRPTRAACARCVTNQRTGFRSRPRQGGSSRAAQRNPTSGQCKEATRDEVVIGHTSLFVAAKNMSPIAALAV